MKKRTMTMGSKMAIATKQAKKKGYKSFKEGSPGDKERDRIAEGIAKKVKVVKGPAKKRRKKK
jgi:hypothetical protein